LSGSSIDLIDIIDPFVPAVSKDAKVWEAAIRMGRLKKYCAILFEKDPAGDMGLYTTVKRIAREIFELSEEGIVLVERGRISWALDKSVSEVSMNIEMLDLTAELVRAVDGVYSGDCVSVVDDRGDVLGIISEDSLIRVLLRFVPQDLRASEIASKPVEVVDYEAPLLEVIGVMVQKGFRRIVVTREGKVVGVVTMMDVIQRVSESHVEGDPESILVGGSVSSIGYEEPLFVSEDTSASKVAKKLLATGSKCAIVGEPKNISGIVTEKDVIRVIRGGIAQR